MKLPKPSLLVLATLTLLASTSFAIAAPPKPKASTPLPSPKSSPLPKSAPLPKPKLDLQALNPGAKVTTGSQAIAVAPELTASPTAKAQMHSPWTKLDLARALELDTSQLTTMTAINPSDPIQTWSSGMTVEAFFVKPSMVRQDYMTNGGFNHEDPALWVVARGVPANRTLVMSCRVSVESRDSFIPRVRLTANARPSSRYAEVESLAQSEGPPDNRQRWATAHMLWPTQSGDDELIFILRSDRSWKYTPGECVLSQVDL